MGMLAKAFDKARTSTQASTNLNALRHSGVDGWYAGMGGLLRSDRNVQAIEYYRRNRGWVNSCVRILSRRIASQPSYVARRMRPGQSRRSIPTTKTVTLRDGKRAGHKVLFGDTLWFESILPLELKSLAPNLELVEGHPLQRAVEEPNRIMIRSDVIMSTVASLEITGKAFWWVFVDEDNRLNLWPLPVHWFEPRHKEGLFSHWIIRPEGVARPVEVPSEQVVYFKWLDPGNPFGALGTLEAQMKPILADDSIAEAQWRGFKNGIHPGLAIVTKRIVEGGINDQDQGRVVLEKDQRDAILNAFLRRYQGETNFNLPVIIDGLIEDIKPITMNMKEMDFLNSGKFTKDRIIQGFGVSAASMGQVENSNRASSAVADEHVSVNSLNPIIANISQTVTAWMGPIFESRGEDLIWFIEECHGTDPEFNYNRDQRMFEAGGLTLNELRQGQGYAPVRGGNVFMMKTPMGVIPIPANIAGQPRTTDEEFDSMWGEVVGEQEVLHGVEDEGQGMVDGEEEGMPDLTPEEQEQLGLPPGFMDAPKPKPQQPPEQRPAPGRQYVSSYKTIGKEGHKAIWLKLHERREADFARGIVSHFRKESRALVAKIRSGAGLGAVPTAATAHAKLIAVARPHIQRIAETGAAAELEAHRPRTSQRNAQLAMQKLLAMKAPKKKLPMEVRRAVDNFTKGCVAEKYWKDVTKRQREQIARIIRVGVKRGDSPAKIADRLEDEIPRLDANRAMQIARTETTGALGAGGEAVRDRLRDEGLLKGKEWLAHRDQVTRDSHVDADEQYIKDGEQFEVGGEHCDYPGDSVLSPEERCNCRCIASAVLKGDRRTRGFMNAWRRVLEMEVKEPRHLHKHGTAIIDREAFLRP